MSERKLLLRRTAGFATLPLLSSLSPFVVLPIIARQASTLEWSALTIGQSVGLVGALAVGYGWPVVGPARVAQTERRARPSVYAESLVSRVLLLLVVAPLAAVVSMVLASGPTSVHVLCALMSLSGVIVGLSISWYCIGSGLPAKIARYEVIPRTVASLISAGLVLVTGWLWLYPVFLAVTFVGSVVAFTRAHGLGSDWRRMLHRPVLRTILIRQSTPTAVELSAGSYTMGGGSLVSTVLPPGQIARFGSADRVNAAAMQAIVAVGNALNPWVAEVEGRPFVHRAKVALSLHVGLGAAGFLGLALFGPYFSDLLFGRRLGFSTATGAAFGVYFFAVSCGTALSRHVLVPRGRVKAVLRGTIVGAAVGVPAVILGARSFGATGGAAGLALGELTVCLTQLGPVVRVMKAQGRMTAPSTSLVRSSGEES